MSFDQDQHEYNIVDDYERQRIEDQQRIATLEQQLAADRDAAIARAERAEAERDEAKKRFTAPIVCMCGSTRFKQTWIAENARLTSEGNIVLSVGIWGHHERVYPSPEQKQALDTLHRRKIDLCDWVWVLDVDGYIGESTRREIIYAMSLGKPIRYLSNKYPAYVEPVDQVASERDAARAEADALRAALSGAMGVIQRNADHTPHCRQSCDVECDYRESCCWYFIHGKEADPTASAALAEWRAMRAVVEAARAVAALPANVPMTAEHIARSVWNVSVALHALDALQAKKESA